MKKRIKQLLKYVINLPGLSSIYSLIYHRQIARRAAQMADRLPTVGIEITNKCNARCVICPNNIQTRGYGVMSNELFEKILVDLKSIGITNVTISFFGEILLDKELFTKFDLLKKHAMTANFFSNGALLNEALIDKILESPVQLIVFSADGFTKATYEAIRRNLNYETVVANIQLLLKKRQERKQQTPRVQLNYVCFDQNKHEVSDFLAFWKPQVDAIEIGVGSNWGGSISLKLPFLRQLYLKMARRYACSRLFGGTVILWDGRVALCCIDYDGKEIMGDVTKESFWDVWKGEPYTRYRQMHLDDKGYRIPLCHACEWAQHTSSFNWWL